MYMIKKLTVRISAALAAAAILLALCGCSEELVGKWRSTSEKETQLIFAATGRVTMSADDIELSGTFTDDGENLVMSLVAPNGQTYVIEATYTIVGNELHLENAKGQVEIFVR